MTVTQAIEQDAACIELRERIADVEGELATTDERVEHLRRTLKDADRALITLEAEAALDGVPQAKVKAAERSVAESRDELATADRAAERLRIMHGMLEGRLADAELAAVAGLRDEHMRRYADAVKAVAEAIKAAGAATVELDAAEVAFKRAGLKVPDGAPLAWQDLMLGNFDPRARWNGDRAHVMGMAGRNYTQSRGELWLREAAAAGFEV